MAEQIDYSQFQQEAKDNLTRAKINFLCDHPFFGHLAVEMKMIEDNSLPTAATDGFDIFYNSAFIAGLPVDEAVFVLGHEILHAVYFHLERRGKRNSMLWNIAADYAVNGDLVKYKVGRFPTKIKVLYEPKYADLTAEEIYDKLIDDLKKRAKSGGLKLSKDGIPLDQETLKEIFGDTLDEHKEKQQEDPKTAAERKQKMKERIVSASQTAKGAGLEKLPKGVRRIVRELVEPVIDWRDYISEQIKSLVKNDYTWMRPSRKGWHTDAVMPGMNYDEEISVAVFIDTSGSIGEDDLKYFLSETYGMVQQFARYKVLIACFDTKLHNIRTYDETTSEGVAEYPTKGGGGTNFELMFKLIAKMDTPPKLAIVFTDGLPGSTWGDPNVIDTVWVIKNHREIVPPFGLYINYTRG